MKIEAWTVPKYPGHNEDHFFAPEQIAPGIPVVLCDGASESYNSSLWAKTLAHGLKHSRDFTEAWLSQRIEEYNAALPAAGLSWAHTLARAKGSFSTFLSLEIQPDGNCLVNAIGDSVAFAIGGDRIIDSIPLQNASGFNQTPTLLATRPDLNKPLKNAGGESFLSGILKTARASHALMLTDALAAWLLERRADSTAIARLLHINSEAKFRLFVEKERANSLLKFDDTTMIKITLKNAPMLTQFTGAPRLPAKSAGRSLKNKSACRRLPQPYQLYLPSLREDK